MENQELLTRLTNNINKLLFSSDNERNTKFAIDTARAILHLAKIEDRIDLLKKES